MADKITGRQRKALSAIVEKQKRSDPKREPVAQKKRWHKTEDPNEAAKQMVETFCKLYQGQAGKRDQHSRLLSDYLGRDVPILSPHDIEQAINDDKMPIIQGIVDTAKAQIASVQRPKPVALTKGGTYRERIEARKYTRFAEAQMWQPCGRWANYWELGDQLVKDGAIWGDGVVKVVPNLRAGTIEISRRFVHDLYVSSADSMYGTPTIWYETYTEDRCNLAEKYPDSESAIMRAAGAFDVMQQRMGEDDDRVQVVEAFRLPAVPGAEGPAGIGRHMIAVQSSTGQTWLEDEEWTEATPPYGFFCWEPNSYGCFSTGVVQGLGGLKDDINEILDYIIENTKACGWGALEFTEGDIVNVESLKSNMPDKHIVRAAGGSGGPITWHRPSPFNPAVIDAWGIIRSVFFDTSGISDMATQGRSDAGITAAVAMRTQTDLRGQRFLPKSRSYEQLAATVGKLTLRAAARLKEKGKSPKSTLFREGYLEEVDFSGINLALDRCEIVVQSQSSSEDTMAGRKQAVQEMATAGYITPEQANEMLMSSNPDIEAFTRQTQAQQRYYQRIISRFQEATEDDWKPRKDFPMPDPILNLKMGIAMMTDGYAETSAEKDAPEFNLDLFREWIVFAWQTLDSGNMSKLTYDDAKQMAVPLAQGAPGMGAPQDPAMMAQPADTMMGAESGMMPPPGVPMQ